MTMPSGSTKAGVKFLGEQDGAAEVELKLELRRCLEQLGVIHRAYLAVVQYGEDPQKSVALCLVAPSGVESMVVPKVGAVFSRMFGPSQYIDIVFVNESQEARLLCVCRPLFTQVQQK